MIISEELCSAEMLLQNLWILFWTVTEWVYNIGYSKVQNTDIEYHNALPTHTHQSQYFTLESQLWTQKLKEISGIASHLKIEVREKIETNYSL